MNDVVMSGLVRLVASGNCWISYQNGYAVHSCQSFTCCQSWALGSLSKCSQLKPFLYRYFFGRYSHELAKLVPLPYSQGRSNCCSDRLHDFSVTIPRCHKNVYVISFFPLSIECFPFTYDLNGFKSRINRHLLTEDFF